MEADIKTSGQSFRDGLVASRGTLICALFLVIVDVVIDGNYMFSALSCPIWFIIAVVRAIVWRVNRGAAVVRILIPIVTGLFVVANYFLQYNIAMDNAARLIQACEHYREASGAYPEQLDDLVPRYLSSIPRAKYCCSSNAFEYSASPPRHLILWWVFPPYGRLVYIFETGGWRYVD